MGFAEVLKCKPDLSRLFLKNTYKSNGCVLKRKTILTLEAKWFNPGSLLVSRVQSLQGSVTNGRMQEITGEHSKDITGVLQNLVRDGLLTQQNQRRWASYRVAEDSPQLPDDSRHWDGDSPQSSPQLVGDSPQLPSNSPQLDRLAGLSVEIQGLLPLAEPARKNKKLPVDQLKGVIQQLCQSRWLSTAELAALVDRDAEKLQSRFLTAMVREGTLELRYPDVRNRPDQAYRAVDGKSS